MAEVSLEMLQTLMLRCLDEQAAIRRENSDIRTLVLGLVDQSRRLDRRMGSFEQRMMSFEQRMGAFDQRMGSFEARFGDLRDDIELMLKAELMGRLGHYEARMDARLAALEERPEPPSS